MMSGSYLFCKGFIKIYTCEGQDTRDRTAFVPLINEDKTKQLLSAPDSFRNLWFHFNTSLI